MTVRDFPNYTIETDGRVFSKASGKYLKPHDAGQGYLQYRLYDGDGKQHSFSAHRLVASAYIENPENKPTVNHMNGVRHDNRLGNLEWATSSEQMISTIGMGYKPNTSGIGKGGLNHGKSRPVSNGEKIYVSATEAERDGFDRNYISQCCRGIIDKYRGYKWNFVSKEQLS